MTEKFFIANFGKYELPQLCDHSGTLSHVHFYPVCVIPWSSVAESKCICLLNFSR